MSDDRTGFRIAKIIDGKDTRFECTFVQEYAQLGDESVVSKRIIEIDKIGLMEFEILDYANPYIPESWRGKRIEARLRKPDGGA